MEFKLGDRVRIKDYGIDRNGKIGTVVHDVPIGSKTEFSQIGIAHDDCINTHDCNGHCRYGYGWYYFAHNLELVNSSADTLILLL